MELVFLPIKDGLHKMKHLRFGAKILFFLLFSTVSMADLELPKIFPRTVVLEETGDVLTLRGEGLYKYLGEDRYWGAFYSLNAVEDPASALQDGGPKRMVFYFLRPVSNFREQLGTAIEVNNAPEILEREQINIGQFLDYFSMPFQKDETIILDFVPNIGMKVTIKGSYKGTIKSVKFYNLVLKTWMGRQPPSKKFQKDLFYLSKGIHM